MEVLNFLLNILSKVIGLVIGLYIAYVIIKKWEKHHGNSSTPKSK